jgi:hypothetical protein
LMEPSTNVLQLEGGKAIQFVDWINEPLHSLVFENPHTRVYRATIPPGKATLYHRHQQDTAYVVRNR